MILVLGIFGSSLIWCEVVALHHSAKVRSYTVIGSGVCVYHCLSSWPQEKGLDWSSFHAQWEMAWFWQDIKVWQNERLVNWLTIYYQVLGTFVPSKCPKINFQNMVSLSFRCLSTLRTWVCWQSLWCFRSICVSGRGLEGFNMADRKQELVT